MANFCHNRRDESLYENSHLRGLSYKPPMFADASQLNMKVVVYQHIKETF
ncbi:hypothetical protein MTBBW1_80033 [Desulfamplus magnetovallimortis]|uniref:Uncharacterized protein n=1 Tax=Desulfamplus magnetovallimortis TaxID=1246637 RepID=L0R434_9BACT|nr:hypothetical protein DEMABW1_80033 [Desulfamplus magnetovallimortis BW-1]SLM32695.1 hypothetical protein MTBBW1_80033 [Desulfamplus magnetovallimortis]